ncbi:MAG: hypothetical protein WDM84_05300 [Bauldia sp.]
MHRSTGSFIRLAAIACSLAALAGCVAVSAPKFGPGPPSMLTPKTARTLGPAPIRGGAVRFAFATITGVPGDARFNLEDDLKKYAATRELAIVPEGDPTATYQVKGYLSAVGDSTGTLLVYVWDVSDLQGVPLYRISGQETAAGSEADPWVGVGSSQIDEAARETIDKLADWVRG